MPGEPGSDHHELDFRVGGQETARAAFAPYGDGGKVEHLEYRSWFADIAADERIVYCYDFTLDGVRRWVSLVTIELLPAGAGTVVTHTEQYALLAYTGDGAQDTAHLKGGTRLQLNALAAAVEGAAAEERP
jgi:uncharacterized protein YndB with AHSA1/START domain